MIINSYKQLEESNFDIHSYDKYIHYVEEEDKYDQNHFKIYNLIVILL